MSSSRLEAFSDGVMAIAITLMAFNIPLPKEFDLTGIIDLLRAVAVLFVSFVVIGAQWVRHHNLFVLCKEVNGKVLWRNILYLFFVSLVPVFTKWIIENPSQVIPALGYDVVFCMVYLTYHSMQHIVISQTENEKIKEINELRNARMNKYTWVIFGIAIMSIIAIFVLSFFYPAVSIIFFIVLPVVSSLLNLWDDRHEASLQIKKRKN